MGAYREALNDKKLAAKVILPLIEFEFSIIGEDSPVLVQAATNKTQLESIFNICKKHAWVTSNSLRKKGNNLYFRLTRSGFKEIYELAGPFSDGTKNNWAQLLIERVGKIGGYRKKEKSTEEKILYLLKKERNKWWEIEEFCLKLRILPSTVRRAVKNLQKKRLIKNKKIGKSVVWKLSDTIPRILPGVTAG